MIDWLIDWLFTVLRPAQEFFTYMETSPLPVKGCKIWAYVRCSGPLSREGSLSCHTCCDMGPRFILSYPKDRHPRPTEGFDHLRPAQEFFTYVETSPLPVKGCKIWAYVRRSGPLSREGSLSCLTCCDTGPQFLRSYPKDPWVPCSWRRSNHSSTSENDSVISENVIF